MIKIAVLDDFQDAARAYPDRAQFAGRAEPVFITNNVTGDGLVGRLLPFSAAVAPGRLA